MAGQTNGIQDFLTFSDVTDRVRELKELLQTAILRLPDSPQKQAFIACLLNKIMMIPEAPTRIGMSKDMAEMEKTRTQMQQISAQMHAVLNKLEARKETELHEIEQNGIESTEDSEA